MTISQLAAATNWVRYSESECKPDEGFWRLWCMQIPGDEVGIGFISCFTGRLAAPVDGKMKFIKTDSGSVYEINDTLHFSKIVPVPRCAWHREN
jgi:hypothetical protein